MSYDFETSQKNLSDLINYYKSNVNNLNRNEATTRLHLIDKLLFDCLGWNRSDCIVEDRFNGTYTDYTFRCPDSALIVEAKKEGLYFELPVGDNKKKYEIHYFEKHFPEIHKAILQAISYCQTRGTPFGIVCNGHQLIAFIGSRTDGFPPANGKALVFDSLENIDADFFEFWRCFSKPGIISRHLNLELLETSFVPVPEKLSANINGYPGYKSRNSLQTDLQILSDVFIEHIVKMDSIGEEAEFIKHSYCKSGALSQYAMISKDILRDRYSAMFNNISERPDIAPISNKKGVNPDFLTDRLTLKPILLIGDVGVGKTTFIRHLFLVDAADIFNSAIVIYINFGSIPTLEEQINSLVEQEIKNQLLNLHSIDIEEKKFVFAILHGDIQKFEKGIYGDLRESDPATYKIKQLEYIDEKLKSKDEYIKLALNHIVKNHKKQIVFFLDNVDQRPDSFQEKVFLIGQTMAENWPVTVFLSIRPETFYRSKTSGTLSAYHPRAFTISPPRVDEVINKRLRYGVNIVRKGVDLGPTGHITIKSQTLGEYLEILVSSFDRNKHLIEFFDNMCGGNIRLALDFLRIFIGSGHIDTEKIIANYKKTGSYFVPFHEFLRAIIYVDHEYYSPNTSVIVNLFDISNPDGKEHFIAPVLLAQMDRWSQNSKNSGYTNLSEIYQYLQNLGFHPNQINSVMQRLLYRNLLEYGSKDPLPNLENGISYYRITTIGAYYVKKLITLFPYIDAMVVDTPILDPEIRASISNEINIRERLERAKLFVEYLDSQWKFLPDYDLAFQWIACKKRINRNIDYIIERIA